MKKVYQTPDLVVETIVPDTAVSSPCAGGMCEMTGDYEGPVNAPSRGGMTFTYYQNGPTYYYCIGD